MVKISKIVLRNFLHSLTELEKSFFRRTQRIFDIFTRSHVIEFIDSEANFLIIIILCFNIQLGLDSDTTKFPSSFMNSTSWYDLDFFEEYFAYIWFAIDLKHNYFEFATQEHVTSKNTNPLLVKHHHY